MRTEPIRRNFASKVARLRSQEAGRATTVIVATLALAAVGSLAFVLFKTTTPPTTGQEVERERDSSPHEAANHEAAKKGGDQKQRSTLSIPESRQTASESTPSSEARDSGGRRSNAHPVPAAANYEEPSRLDHRPRPKDTRTQTNRHTAGPRDRKQSQPGGRELHDDEFASESMAEEVSDPLPGFDLSDEDFLESADDNWGYEALSPRIANQAGLEEGFLVVGFEGEFVHGPEALRSKASRPDQPDLVAIGVWNPWTGEQATVMLPLDSLISSELPELPE